MVKPSGPSFKCKRLPRVYNRNNTKKSKYCKKIINNFFIGNQFISINNENVYQYNSNNYQFGSGISKDFNLNHSFSDKNANCIKTSTSGECKAVSNNFMEGQIHIDHQLNCSLQRSFGTELSQISSLSFNKLCNFKNAFHAEVPHITQVKKDKISALRDLTNRSPGQLSTLNVNSLMLKSPPNLLCALSKCLESDIKGKKKKLKRMKDKISGSDSFVHISASEMKTPLLEKRNQPSPDKNNSLSSGTSTPFCERKYNKKDWELSPIEYYLEDDSQNDSLHNFKGFKDCDIPVKGENLIMRISQLSVDEDNCKKAGEEIISNCIEIESLGVKKKLFNEDDQEPSMLDQQEQLCVEKNQTGYSDDIFESFSTNETEAFKKNYHFSKPEDSIQSYLCNTLTKMQSLSIGDKSSNDREFSNKISFNNCIAKSTDKVSLSSKVDSCDYWSLKTGSVFDSVSEGDNSLNFSFHFCRENLDNKSKQSFVPQNQMVSESNVKIIPGKKWRRSVLAAGKKQRVTMATSKEKLNSSIASGWNIRFSLNHQSCSNHCDEVLTHYRKTVQVNKLNEIKEQSPSQDTDIQSKLRNDSSCSASYTELNDFKPSETSLGDDEVEEFNFTFVVHQQVANILQKDDLNKTLLSVSPNSHYHKRYAEKNVLNLCSHSFPVEFCDGYPDKFLKYCKKIGEGIYGEVFCLFPPCSEEKTVLKIIPIEGDKIVNCSPQKTYSEVFSEMCIAFSLSRLKNYIDNNYTDGFCSLLRMTCLKGKYPARLIALWNEYDKSIRSENDSPTIFDSAQLYIALEMLHGGEPLESYQFSSARQAYSILLQVIYTLAVAEKAYEFEHRDLHWGNVLISKTCKSKIKFMIEGNTFYVTSYGKKSTIIDYTLSRIRLGKFDIYNDISNDEEIFKAHGDEQFDVYRNMRDDVKNNWQLYVPKSNVRWVHYLASKCYEGVNYKANHNIHRSFLIKIKCLGEMVLRFSSAFDIVKALN